MDPGTERLAHALLFAVLAGVVWTYARERHEHRPIAYLVAWELVADVARLALGRILDAHEPPYEGGLLAGYYLDHALVLSFRFAFLATCLVVFAQMRPTLAAAGYAATLLGFVALKEATGLSLLTPHAIVATVVAAGCSVLFARVVLAPRARLRPPDSADAALAMLLVGSIAAAVIQHVPDSTWPEIRYTDNVVRTALVLAYAGALAHSRIRTARRRPGA